MEKVLVVEDNTKIADLICNFLKQNYHVFHANNVASALKAISDTTFHVACLDIILPDGSGINLLKKIKSINTNTKVIMLTKKVFIEDKLACFKLGADDYLPKPFYPEELMARIEKLLCEFRISIQHKSHTTLDVENSSFKYKKALVFLTPTELVILRLLLNKIKYVSIGDIITEFKKLGIKQKTNDSIMVSISRLKKKLNNNLGLSIIKNRYGHGYYMGL